MHRLINEPGGELHDLSILALRGAAQHRKCFVRVALLTSHEDAFRDSDEVTSVERSMKGLYLPTKTAHLREEMLDVDRF